MKELLEMSLFLNYIATFSIFVQFITHSSAACVWLYCTSGFPGKDNNTDDVDVSKTNVSNMICCQ